MQSIMQIQDLEKVYGNKGNITKALNGVSFEVFPGEYVGVYPWTIQQQDEYGGYFLLTYFNAKRMLVKR